MDGVPTLVKYVSVTPLGEVIGEYDINKLVEAVDNALLPASLTAFTLNVYDCPVVNPLIVIGLDEPLVVV